MYFILWLCWILFLTRAFSSCGEWGLSPVAGSGGSLQSRGVGALSSRGEWGAVSSCGEWGLLSSRSVLAAHCGGFSRGAQALGTWVQ